MLRLSSVVQWAGAREIGNALRSQLLGRVLVLPAEWPAWDREELCDTVSLLARLPVRSVATVQDLAPVPAGTSALVVVSEPVLHAPAPVDELLVVCERRRQADELALEIPHEVLQIRDALIECIGRHHSGSPLARIMSRADDVADSPATALRFADAGQSELLRDSRAGDKQLFLAGLGAVVQSLLRGLDPRVAQWLLALALAPQGVAPESLVDSGAAMLGKDAALTRGMDHGLVLSLPGGGDGLTEMRRGLEALSRLDRGPGAPTVIEVAAALRSRLPAEIWPVLDSVSRPPRQSLGLTGPIKSGEVFGRTEIVQRLASLMEPAAEVPTCILYGLAGIGKTTVAAELSRLLTHRLEPVWVRFSDNAQSGWLRVALALGLNPEKLGLKESEKGVPLWVYRLHEKLRAGSYLIVVDEVDQIAEDKLADWLPTGPGRAAVLVLSRNPQRPLQRAHDAIGLRLSSLSLEDSRRLLQSKLPSLSEDIARGGADGLIRLLDGHPAALSLLTSTIEQQGFSRTVDDLSSGSAKEDPIAPILEKAIAALDPESRAVLNALAVCAPAGSPEALPFAIAGVALTKWDSILSLLAERSFVLREPRLVHAHPLVRLFFERERQQAPEEWRRRDLHHATQAGALMRSGLAENALIADDLIQDVCLATRRMAQRCRDGETVALECCIECSRLLADHPRGANSQTKPLAIEGFRAALGVVDRNAEPPRWADLQVRLGVALVNYWSGDRATNLEYAIAAFQEVLCIFRKDAHPRHHYRTRMNLATAFGQRLIGDRANNLREALQALISASQGLHPDESPRDWAIVQLNLSAVYLDLYQTQSKAEYLRKSLQAARKAVTKIERRSDLESWASAQDNLANALRLKGARSEAVSVYRDALSYVSMEALPSTRADLEHGLALALLSGTRTKEEHSEAIQWLESALGVFTEADFPRQRARALRALAQACIGANKGPQVENLTLALWAIRSVRHLRSAGLDEGSSEELDKMEQAATAELTRLQASDHPEKP